MAGKKKDPTDLTDPTDQTDQTDLPGGDALGSGAGRAWLAHELAQAERDVAHGPNGAGWTHNESLRPALVERAEFLRALMGLLE